MTRPLSVLPLDVREAIRAARRSGLTLADIRATAAETEWPVSIATIRQLVEDVPQPFKRTGRRGASPADKARVLAMVTSGRSYRETAAALGVAPSTIWKLSRHLGLPRGQRPGGVRKAIA